jgi:4-hydroxy-tetrahydrodipicolinate reductase
VPNIAGATAGADVLLQATTSDPSTVPEEIAAALAAAADVVTAAEWMFHPWLRHGRAAARIDAAARQAGRRVIGCGANPGFSFETLPLVLARSVSGLRFLDITRIADVSRIGPGDFRHVGFGLTADRFAAHLASGAIEGHIGFPESMAAVAERCGWSLDRIEESWEPALADKAFTAAGGPVAAGTIAAITQTASGYAGGECRIRMTLEMLLDPAAAGREPQERVVAEGHRTVTLTSTPAASPVDGAAALMLSAARALSSLPPGLHSPLDLPLGGAIRRPRGAVEVETERSGGRALHRLHVVEARQAAEAR